MSLYAKGYNQLIGPMKYTIEEYQRALPEVTGAPKGKVILTQGTADRDIDGAAKAFAEAKQVTPASHADLQALADAVIATARAVRKDYGDAVRYYAAENFKDDKGEGAKAIDGRMRASVEAYAKAVDKMQDRMGQLELESMEAELKTVDQNKPGYYFRAFNLEAKRFLGVMDKSDKVPAALENVKAMAEKLRKFAETRPDAQVAFKNYVTNATGFESQAIAYARNVKDSKEQPNPSLLISRYNNLVQIGNALYQLDDQGLLK